MFGITDIDTYN